MFVTEDSAVTVEFLNYGTAWYNNGFGLLSPGNTPEDPGNLNILDYTHDASIGQTYFAGNFLAGSEIIAFIDDKKNYDAYGTWYTGPADRNSDNTAHAYITQEGPQTWIVEFEDLNMANSSPSANNYQDCVLRITVTPLPKITGGGYLTGNEGQKCSFGFNMVDMQGELDINMQFTDHQPIVGESEKAIPLTIKINGTASSWDYFAPNGGEGLYYYADAKVKGPMTGNTAVSCQVTGAVEDIGGTDYFKIMVINGPYAGYCSNGTPYVLDEETEKGSIVAHYFE